MKTYPLTSLPRVHASSPSLAVGMFLGLFSLLSAMAGELIIADSRNDFRSVDTSTGATRVIISAGGEVRHLGYDASMAMYCYTTAGGDQFRYFHRVSALTGDLDGYQKIARKLSGNAIHGGGGNDGKFYNLAAVNAKAATLLWQDTSAAGTSAERSGEIKLIAAPGWNGPALGGSGDMTIQPVTGMAWFLTTDASGDTHLCKAQVTQPSPMLYVVANLRTLHASQQLSFDSTGSLWLSSATGRELYALSEVDGRRLRTLVLQDEVQVKDMAPGHALRRSGKDSKTVQPVVHTEDTSRSSELRGIYLMTPQLIPYGISSGPRVIEVKPMSPSCAGYK